MFELMVENIFSAAHQVIGSNGPCESLHGHTWKVQVFIQGERLNDAGMLVDFKFIKEDLKEVLKDYDHKFLNDSLKMNPTAENIAKDIYEKLKIKHKFLSKIIVWESPTAYASYYLSESSSAL